MLKHGINMQQLLELDPGNAEVKKAIVNLNKVINAGKN